MAALSCASLVHPSGTPFPRRRTWPADNGRVKRAANVVASRTINSHDPAPVSFLCASFLHGDVAIGVFPDGGGAVCVCMCVVLV